MKIYTAVEAEKATGINKRLFSMFRKYGLLKGIKFGEQWKYDSEEIDDFIRRCRGYDLGDEQKIKYYAPEIIANK